MAVPRSGASRTVSTPTTMRSVIDSASQNSGWSSMMSVFRKMRRSSEEA